MAHVPRFFLYAVGNRRMPSKQNGNPRTKSENHSHRPSGLRQSNKPFKSRHSTKHALKAHGKTELQPRSSHTSMTMRTPTKQDKRNTAKQLRMNQREKVLNEKRMWQGKTGMTKLVTVVPMSDDVSVQIFINLLKESANLETQDSGMMDAQNSAVVTIPIPKQHQVLQMLIPNSTQPLSILDACRVSDYVVILLSAEKEADNAAENLLRQIQAQGVPSVIPCVQHLDNIHIKSKNDVKKSLASFIGYFFPENATCTDGKVLAVDTSAEVDVFVRTVTGKTPRIISWREKRPYMIADHAEFQHNDDDNVFSALTFTINLSNSFSLWVH